MGVLQFLTIAVYARLHMPESVALVVKTQGKEFISNGNIFLWLDLLKYWDKYRFDFFFNTLNDNSSVITSTCTVHCFLKVFKDDTREHVIISFPSFCCHLSKTAFRQLSLLKQFEFQGNSLICLSYFYVPCIFLPRARDLQRKGLPALCHKRNQRFLSFLIHWI